MSTLIVTLALRANGPATEYDYALTSDDGNPPEQGRALAALLPAPSRRRGEVVAVVPARAMSWHRVQLPPVIGKFLLTRQSDQPRLLAGLMEEYLLDDPDQLHFAVFPDAQPEAPVWVAVCNRAWLQDAVQALASVQLPVSRIVPEFAPIVHEDRPSIAHVTADMEPAQLVLCTRAAVTVLPLGAAAASLVKRAEPVEIQAEPAVAALAEQTLGRPAGLQTRAQRQLQAASSAWNLAQFELRVSFRHRVLKALSQGWLVLRREPQWRPLRWGVMVMMATHVVGLNVWAWQEGALLAEKRRAIRSLFSQTFPEVRVIVDAPLQMAREVAALQQAEDGPPGLDLIESLMTVASTAPAYAPLHMIELSAHEVRIKGPALPAEAATSLVSQLTAQGLQARMQGEQLTLMPGDGP